MIQLVCLALLLTQLCVMCIFLVNLGISKLISGCQVSIN